MILTKISNSAGPKSIKSVKNDLENYKLFGVVLFICLKRIDQLGNPIC